MASSTPPHYLTPPKPTYAQNPHHPPLPHKTPRLQPFSSSSSSSSSKHRNAQNTLLPPPAAAAAAALSSDFRRSRSTKSISKRNPTSHPPTRLPASPSASLLLSHLLSSSPTAHPPTHLPHNLSVPDDYCFILHSLPDSGQPGSAHKALSFFNSSLPLMRDPKEKGKLLTSAISSLGKLGRPDLARQIFNDAVKDGFGDTVFAHTAIISAFARSGRPGDAVSVFGLMRKKGLKPNVVSYNAVIDACVKGGGDVKGAIGFFREMIEGKVRPDSKTFNSLLAGCSRAGEVDYARALFEEMMRLGIGRDIYTYNTFIDAVSKCGNMELAVKIMTEMPANDLRPNVVTFSTLIDGYSKLERFNEALDLYREMRMLGIKLDRVCYNTLLSIYVKIGKYEEIARVCEEMEAMGIDKDTVTYNSLIKGYGKQGRLDIVSFLVRDMREKGVPLSVLTYSTLIDIYSKAGLYGDAANVFLDFKESGLKADVVLYSSLIDTLAKNGLVECAVWLLDEMVRVGIEPNVVTYNAVIDGFGKSRDFMDEDGAGVFGPIVKGIGQPKVEEARRSEELFYILGLFQRMVQRGVKPNVVTFSAILNACSRCNSFKDASILLDQLRLFDSFAYGIAHGLLIGSRDVWVQARSLFDELRHMDLPTSSAFYNALTDMLWHFGQKRGAQQVVLEGVQRQVWENAWSEFCLDLHLMSSGAAQAMVHAWLLSVRSIVFEGRELPEFLSILTGWGKHSKVAGASTLRRVVESLLKSIGAPFQLERFNIGRFVSPSAVIASWLRESGTISILLLRDERPQMANPENLLPQLQALQL